MSCLTAVECYTIILYHQVAILILKREHKADSIIVVAASHRQRRNGERAYAGHGWRGEEMLWYRVGAIVFTVINNLYLVLLAHGRTNQGELR